MTKIGNGRIPLRIGNLINGVVYGGPYTQKPDDMFGVKMAAEINLPCNVDIPTQDFSVPRVDLVRRGVVQTLMAMANGHDVYAGCMGGIGRTGLFLAILAKVQIEYRRSKHRAGRGEDPVGYVRQHFIPHAVETQEQQQYIANFDVTDIVEWVDTTQRAMGLSKGFTRQVEITALGDEERTFVPVDDPEGWYTSTDIGPNDHVTLSSPIATPDDFYAEDDMATFINKFGETMARDLDWIDRADADSADEADELTLSDQVNDMWQYLDEQDDRVEKLEKYVSSLQRQVIGLVSHCHSIEKKLLTKQSLFSKIRSIFR